MTFASIVTAMIAELDTDMPDITWEHGYRDEPPERSSRGYVWGADVRENPEDVQQEITEIGIRVYPNFQQRRGKARDSTTFEDIADQLRVALKDKQTTIPQAAGYWFLRVTETVIDQDEQRIDATVLVFGQSMFAV